MVVRQRHRLTLWPACCACPCQGRPQPVTPYVPVLWMCLCGSCTAWAPRAPPHKCRQMQGCSLCPGVLSHWCLQSPHRCLLLPAAGACSWLCELLLAWFGCCLRFGCCRCTCCGCCATSRGASRTAAGCCDLSRGAPAVPGGVNAQWSPAMAAFARVLSLVAADAYCWPATMVTLEVTVHMSSNL